MHRHAAGEVQTKTNAQHRDRCEESQRTTAGPATHRLACECSPQVSHPLSVSTASEPAGPVPRRWGAPVRPGHANAAVIMHVRVDPVWQHTQTVRCIVETLDAQLMFDRMLQIARDDLARLEAGAIQAHQVAGDSPWERDKQQPE